MPTELTQLEEVKIQYETPTKAEIGAQLNKKDLL